MTHLSPIENLFAVEVPGDAFNLRILNSANGNPAQGVFYNQPGVESPPWVNLPPGSYETLFTTINCSEAQAKIVVPFVFGNQGQRYEAGYWNYLLTDERNAITVDAATESLNSLLRANGLQPETKFLLIKKMQ